MAELNHLAVQEVAPLSAGKSTGVDDGNNQISQAIADRANILISTTSPVTVAEAVYTKAYEFKLVNDTSPPVADFTVQFAARTTPDRHRGIIKVVNNTSYVATLEVPGQTAPKPTVEGGQTCYHDLFSDEILEGPGSGGVGSAGDWKDSVRVATTANITLSGEQTLDGVLTSADRVLVKDQSTASENGLYLSDASTWTRTTDADTDGKVTSGLSVHVEEGTLYGDKNFQITTNDPITLDTTSITFTQYGAGGTVAFNDLTDVVIATPVAGDMVLHDGTDWDNKSINDLTEDTTPDKAADYVMTWDASGADAKKVKIGNALGSNVEASVKRTADLTGQNHTTAAAIAFNTENYDTDTWHDNSTNPSRLTVPAGVGKVDLNAYVKVTNIVADEWVLLQFYKNGTAIDGLAQRVETGGTERNISLTALGVECVATDYFETFLQVEADTTVDIDADSTFTARVSISGAIPVGGFTDLATFDFGSSPVTNADIDVTGYDEIIATWDNVGFSASASLIFRVGTNASTFLSGSTDYRRFIFNNASLSGGTASEIFCNSNDPVTAGEFGRLSILNAASSAYRTDVDGWAANETGVKPFRIAGKRDATEVNTHIRFTNNGAGTINAGTMRVQGR